MPRPALLLVACLSLLLTGCPDNGTSPPPPPASPAPDPLYEACVATDPVDSGNPNKPVITLLGADVISHPLGAPYQDAGAAASDPHDGDITGHIRVTGLSELNTDVVGDYLIRYNVADSAGLAAVEVVRMVRVNAGEFNALTARDIGTTGAHMGYYEHLPIHYSDNPPQKFPLIVFIHGWSHARFLDPYTVQAPLSTLESGNLVQLIKAGQWDDSRPFIVLSPQKCVDALTYGVTANRMKLFIDYAINTYKVDTSRIYMSGHSQGSGDTWDYVTNYPLQLAAVVPVSGGYGTLSGCVLKQTPAWAFNGEADTTVPYQNQVDTVNSINACNPAERARVTVFPGVGHNDINDPLFNLTGLGQGMAAYDIYDQDIYDWMPQHSRAVSTAAGASGTAEVAATSAAQVAAGTLAVSPDVIPVGRSATLRWWMPGAESCRASGDWQGARPASGMESVKPPRPRVYSYMLSCHGAGGDVAQSVGLEVRAGDDPAPESARRDSR